jgi:hypothetical protein
VRFSELKHQLRKRSEYSLRLVAMENVGRRYPARVSKSALPQVGVFWRFLFVPLFRRVPWSFKQKAMRTLKMTARGWPADARQFGEPWRPPPFAGRQQRERDADSGHERAQAGSAER